jgi:hypothetical protein
MLTTVSSISPDNPSEAIKTILAVIVEHAGGDFVGVLPLAGTQSIRLPSV